MASFRILCISFSPLLRDARVLRQLGVLAEFGDVTTVGYGDAPAQAAHHVRVPDDRGSLPRTAGGVMALAARRWARAERLIPSAAYARARLDPGSFDLVVANDARSLPLAFDVAAGAPVWADMHEWAPEERTHVLAWRLLIAPFMRFLCRKYLPRATSVSTVCQSIAELYERDFGVRPAVVRNASARVDAQPSPLVPSRLRLVHSGAAVAGRNLEATIDAVKALPDGVTLDLFLVPGGDGGAYERMLRKRAANCARIRFNDPVPPRELPHTLNAFDVGVFWIPPVHTNARFTLPNKLFDYVQARLALAVGPTVEMKRLVTQYTMGVVSAGFDVDDIIRSVKSLDAQSVERFKRASDRAADELNFEREADVIRRLLTPALAGHAEPDARP